MAPDENYYCSWAQAVCDEVHVFQQQRRRRIMMQRIIILGVAVCVLGLCIAGIVGAEGSDPGNCFRFNGRMYCW
jgi:predicted nucleic acid-binding Zn ribbon protein